MFLEKLVTEKEKDEIAKKWDYDSPSSENDSVEE